FRRAIERMVVKRRQKQEVALFLSREARELIGLDALGIVAGIQNRFADSRHAERKNCVHVVPEPPALKCTFGLALSSVQPVAERIEKRVEVVVFDDEHALAGHLAVVLFELPADLQAERGLAASFLAENDRRRWMIGIAVDFVPRGMMCAGEA